MLTPLVCLLVALHPLAPAQKDHDKLAESRAQFASLKASDRRDVVEWFSADVVYINPFRRELHGFVLGQSGKDPGFLPEREQPATYDAAVHAAAQPISRRWAKGRAASKLTERMFARIPKRDGQSGWRYEYGSRRVVRTAKLRDSKRIFANALQGLAPYWDLVEAQCELLLDEGQLQANNAAFDHAYTDREGRAYEEVTLYDAWASGGSMEMPDVDCLGIVHDLLDDWSTWTAPVSKQDSLYGRIAELYKEVHQYRGLRRALARTYIVASPVLRDGYGGSEVALHALWEEYGSDPTRLAPELPDGDGWAEFWTAWRKRLRKEPELWKKGDARRRTLATAGDRTRALAERILGEFESSGEKQ